MHSRPDYTGQNYFKEKKHADALYKPIPKHFNWCDTFPRSAKIADLLNCATTGLQNIKFNLSRSWYNFSTLNGSWCSIYIKQVKTNMRKPKCCILLGPIKSASDYAGSSALLQREWRETVAILIYSIQLRNDIIQFAFLMFKTVTQPIR